MDFYRHILITSWPVFFAQLAAAFIVVNLISPCSMSPTGAVERPLRQLHRRLLLQRVQTLGHIGLWRDGVSAPCNTNLLVTVESFSAAS